MVFPKDKFGGYARVHLVRCHGNVSFIECHQYDQGLKLNLFITKDKTKNYDILKKEVYPGCILKITDTLKDLEKPRHLLIEGSVVSKSELFPQNYPRNIIKDQETRIQDRVLTVLSDSELRDRLRVRSKVLRRIRKFYEKNGFLELEVPVLEPQTGGAAAKPFITYALDKSKEYFLRICHEFPLKKGIISGLDRVYHMGSVFRNEDATPHHSPEYTLLQSYMVSDKGLKPLLKQMELVCAEIWHEISGTWFYQGMDLRKPWPKIYWKDLLKGDLSLENCKLVEGKIKRDELGLPLLFHLVSPPENLLPLAKSEKGFALAYESYLGGLELSTCYVEETDSKQLLRKWSLCQHKGTINEDFLKNLKYGMPPTLGFGLGIDRVLKAFMGVKNIRDVTFFPNL